MDGRPLLRKAAHALTSLLVTAGPAFGWPLGEPQVNNDRYYPPPSVYGYNLFDRAPTYYGGGNYREYYNFGRGFGYADFPSQMIYMPVKPIIRNRSLPPKPLPPIDYVPTSHLFPQARFEVHVPADAQVWLEGKKTEQTGEVRSFISPPLTPGEDYLYTIRARWQEGGKDVEQERKVVVHSGSRLNVRFPLPPGPEPLPTPRELNVAP
jgi:uncharacterized protein (TIGR03000 family)